MLQNLKNSISFIIFFLVLLSGHLKASDNTGNVILNLKDQPDVIRDTIVLNGLWDFFPADQKLQKSPPDNWGTIWVPGSWETRSWQFKIPGIEKAGNWNFDLAAVNHAVYQKKIKVPESWKGNSILLDVQRVSTDAIISVDNKPADTINWPDGVVDITSLVTPGKEHTLNVSVYSVSSPYEAEKRFGTPVFRTRIDEGPVASRGITGNVFLRSAPASVRIADVYVQTSVRQKEITFNIELENISKTENLDCVIDILDQNQKTVKTFSQNIEIAPAGDAFFTVKGKWENPLLWDLNQPNLYTAKVYLKKGEILDEYPQRFGFREFWIEGRDFYLNHKKINLRPTNNVIGSGMDEWADAGIDAMRKAGYNFIEIWPSDVGHRGQLNFNKHFAERASQKGMLIAAPLPPGKAYIKSTNWEYTWDKPGVKAGWKKEMLAELKKLRNEPSIVMWGNNPNYFGHADDQNPLVIGQKGWVQGQPSWQHKADAGMESIDTIKQYDPTRPVYSHHGAYVGDVHTMNHYLCLLPLQEREEWLSHYSEFGNMPYMAIEFGTPLECTMFRGKAHFAANMVTEPLFTEYCAIYQGKDAYHSETAAYREEIKKMFLQGQHYQFWQNNKIANNLSSFQDLEWLFLKNTWQSWRTWGISGGMNPWNDAHGFERRNVADSVKMPEFEEGRTGTYFSWLSKTDLHYWEEPYWDVRPSGKMLIKINQSTLGYIAGKPGEFTEKKHNYFENGVIGKQVVLINDTRDFQDYSYSCLLILDGEKIKVLNGSGKIKFAENERIPVNFQLPTLPNSEKTDGKLILEAKIGSTTHTDTFNLRVFPEAETTDGKIACFDPAGTTKQMLKDLGLQVTDWDGNQQESILVIGRDILSKGFEIPGDLKQYVVNGGRLLIMGQKREWFEEQVRFRTAQYQSRYIFPVDENHPVVKNLDEIDLRNWDGFSTLEKAYPDYLYTPHKEGKYDVPYYGWHWGNRGTVSSVPLEKPHFSGWRPILECEFDLAYTPLMELEYGKGKVVICTVDLEDYYRKDPAAALLAKNLVAYLNEDEIVPSVVIYYSGDEETKQLLDQVGLVYNEISKIPSEKGLVIIGNRSEIREKDLTDFVKQGGKVLCLNQQATTGLFDVKLKFTENFKGALSIPSWPELEGVSASDTRWRTESTNHILTDGCEIACNGMFGKKRVGKGTVFFAQVNPNRLAADSLTYFRYTRWRQNRLLSQLLANLGGTFKNDERIFDITAPVKSINLEGTWLAAVANDGKTPNALQLVQPGAEVSAMEEKQVPAGNDGYSGKWTNPNGEFIYRKTVEIPSSMAGRDMELNLGVISAFDEVYFNGRLVGKTPEIMHDFLGFERNYNVPGNLVKEGDNVIAVRIAGNGGLQGGSEYPIRLREKVHYYHPDYLQGFSHGDDPYRYFRW